MPVTNVKSAWVGGNLYFYDKAENEIAHLDGTNRMLVVPTGSALTVAGVTVDDSTLAVTGLTATAAELNTLAGKVASASFTIGAEGTPGANQRAIAVQLKDAAGADIAYQAPVQITVLADANGDAFATGGSTGLTVGTDGALLAIVAKKLFQAISESDGDLDLVWTDSGTEAVYLAVLLPNGALSVSAVIQNAP